MATPSEPRDFSTIGMSPEARDYYARTFLPLYQQLQTDVNKTPLSILVWGPGESGGRLYAKRLQIRGLLREAGYAAVFSEELEKENCNPSDYSSKMKELLQAIAADFIVVIQASAGSIAEIHDFAHFLKDLGSKMLVFIDSKYQTGYSYTGALHELNMLYKNVRMYEDPKDIDECHLATAVLDRVTILRWAKWAMMRVK